jgi:predicted nucleic acid-binding protein
VTVTVVADSGPLIHLSIVQQFHLLQQLFHQVSTIPHVVEEVATQGKGRPGDAELRQGIQDKWISIVPVTDQALIQRLTAPNLSEIDSAVIANAVEISATVVLSDDQAVRRVPEREGLSVIGTVGILTHARMTGLVGQLKPLLDQLIDGGFYLDPAGRIYQDALKRAGER